MKRIEIEIDPKEDGTIDVIIKSLIETDRDGLSGTYATETITVPVPKVKK